MNTKYYTCNPVKQYRVGVRKNTDKHSILFISNVASSDSSNETDEHICNNNEETKIQKFSGVS